MQSVITSKFQTTIPKKVREQLRLSVHDALDWRVENGKIVVSPIHFNFLGYQNSVKIGEGDISEDIKLAKRLRSERFK